MEMEMDRGDGDGLWRWRWIVEIEMEMDRGDGDGSWRWRQIVEMELMDRGVKALMGNCARDGYSSRQRGRGNGGEDVGNMRW